jgi:cytochrome c553
MTWNKKAWVFFFFLLLSPTISRAQTANSPAAQERILKRGAAVFAATCTGYCHGANGVAGTGAPALAGRGLDGEYIVKTVMYGIPGTAMVAWGQRIPKDDSSAVIEYVKSLNGIVAVRAGGPPPVLSEGAAHGHDLFFDSAGELMGCSNCHQVNGSGIAVTPPIGSVPASVSDLRNLATAQVVTATVGQETFPALLAMQIPGEIKLYDLTTIPPVLRTFSSSEVKLSNGSSWKHSSVMANYNDTDLESVLSFLRAMQPVATQP